MHILALSKMRDRLSLTTFCILLSALSLMVFGSVDAFATSGFLGRFHTIKTIASTIPRNDDLNPYGVAVVPHSIGKLVAGDVLVSNFNNKQNLQGTGTTIVQISPTGTLSLFAQIDAQKLPGACPGGVGLTTALVVLQRGWVIVGSLPTSNGMAATAKAGCLIVLNSQGQPVETFSGSPINGPWDMTAVDGGNVAVLFVTNVLNGTVAASPKIVKQGTVVRELVSVPKQGKVLPQIEESTIIGNGFAERTDPAALVVGPTGVGLGNNGTLYIADTVESRIATIPNALTRKNAMPNGGNTLTQKGFLKGPLGLTIAPNGDILTVNGGDGNIVEITPAGQQTAKRLLDNTGTPPGTGCLFGVQVMLGGAGVYFVDDCFNTLRLLF
ncbi:MAG TPA: hypothetical protein VKY19_20840 [Ktedonosporobacter sp.]|nr:hypothetical protein [Ktedonosporobacter sp.]